MDAFLTTIMGWGPNWAPRNWSLCAGQTMAISQYTAIFSLIGTIYGGDGRTTFMLPDLRGRTPISWGTRPGGKTYVIGNMGGLETHTHIVSELPVHNHAAVVTGNGSGPVTGAISASTTVKASSATGTTQDPEGHYWGTGGLGQNIYGTTTGATMAADAVTVSGTVALDLSGIPNPTVTIGNTGAAAAFNIMQPYLAISFIFCMAGIFPPRN